MTHGNSKLLKIILVIALLGFVIGMSLIVARITSRTDNDNTARSPEVTAQNSDAQQGDNEQPSDVQISSTDMNNDERSNAMNITINGTTLTATMEDNSSAQALLDMLQSGPLTIDIHDYAGMEKVGTLDTTLPTNDQEITTEPGDIILYQGNQITIYYDNNQWNLTKLGHIDNVTTEELRQLLGGDAVTVTFSK